MYGKFGKLVFQLEDEADDDEEEDDTSPGVILPHAAAWKYSRKRQPEILVVDEAHRILRDETTYQALMKMSASAHAVLLLTATPRSDDADNVCRLLRLGDPERFGSLSDQQLQELLEKRGKVETLVQSLREHNPDMPAARKAWKELGLRDQEVTRLLASRAKDRSLRHIARHAAALIVDRYDPGARIVRYQRKFLAADNAMAMRIVEPMTYEPTREEIGVIGGMHRWLDLVRDAGHAEAPEWHEASGALIQSVFSSPLAVTTWLEARQGKLKPHDGVTADPVRLMAARLKALPALPGEAEVLKFLAEKNKVWLGETRQDRAAALPLSRLPRYLELVKAIRAILRQEKDAQLLIFTGFEANVKPLFQLLRREFSGKAELFHIDASQPWRTREKSAFLFQEHEGAAILVSDELGGEGRNFQFVISLLHFDLPPAPWLVEQRIGRCDRVGREVELDVDSQVFLCKNQLDSAIFNFFADGLNVFNESIAPIEGSTERVTRRMMAACIARREGGVRAIIDDVAEELGHARQAQEEELLVRSRIGVGEALSVAARLDDSEELRELKDAVVNYAQLFESRVDERPNRIAITVGEYHSLRGAPGVLPEMLGHFDRRQAVRRERLEFFSPGHPFVRELTQAALRDSPDRVAMVARQGLTEPAIVFSFLVKLDTAFFQAINELPTDLRPPLFCKSAECFGTTVVRFAITFDGRLIPEDNHDEARFFDPAEPEDDSLHEGPLVMEYLPDTWDGIVDRLTEQAWAHAETIAEARVRLHRDTFEDLLCEVLTRVFPTQEWIDEKVDHIMSRLARLVVDLDTVVAMFPALDGMEADDDDDDGDDDEN
jgi:hypothetical protein